MKPEFKLVRELIVILINIFCISFAFDMLNWKNSVAVFFGIASLICLFLADCAYVRTIILPMFMKKEEK
jgi:hypothetical protein